jgi:hypothetical protein
MQATGGTRRLNRGLANTQAMRNGQNKRMRGRNRKSHNPLTRVYESNGPDVKIRGSAAHIAEKYVQLARDAQSSGDPVSAENYHQHAEHYFRLIASAQEQFRQPQQFYRGDGGMDMRADGGEEDEDEVGSAGAGDQPSFGTRDPQPYLPRDAQFHSPREQQNFAPREQQNFAPREQQNFAPREQQNFPREQQGHGRHQPAQPPPVTDDDGNVERLPSFITGGSGQPAPTPAPQAHQGNGPNGFEGQGDRFPLHRRRRRHRGPRTDTAQGGQGGSDGEDAPQGPRNDNE